MGWAKAIMIPEIRLAIVVCAAKPMAMPTIPAEANMPFARLLRASMSMTQKMRPSAMKKITDGGEPLDHAKTSLCTRVGLGQIAAAGEPVDGLPEDPVDEPGADQDRDADRWHR